MSTSNSAIHHPLSCTGVPGSDVRRLTISDILSKSKKCLSSKLLGIPEAVHDRIMFAMRSLAGDLKVLSSLSETMAKIISSIGFVFLFKGVIMTKLEDFNSASSDLYGKSVSIDGDYAIIGVPGNGNLGAAFIFKKSGSSWNEQAELIPTDGGSGDDFGYSVSISGDYALIGAYETDVSSNTDQGSAYIFMRSGKSWNQQTQLTASDGSASDYFGSSASLSGDYALIGAYGDSSSRGSAYIFMRSGTAWNQEDKLTASDGSASDYFGVSASLSGDYAVLGAYYDDVTATNQGSAYVFLRSGTVWSQQTKLTASDGAGSDYFGWSVAIDGDYIIVGAYYKDVSGNVDSGGAYIFMRLGSVWSEQAILEPSDGATSDYFGSSVSLSSDYAIIGTSHDDDGSNTDQGSAYVFLLSGSDWNELLTLTASDASDTDWFGTSIALDGEFALIGAPGEGSYSGAVYTFCLDGQTWEDCDLVDGSMMIGRTSILGMSLISLLLIIM